MISKQQRFSLCVIVSVLLCVWMDVASGMMSIQLIPQYPIIQGSVTLSLTGIIGKLASFTWYKGSKPDSNYSILTYIPGTDQVIKGPQNNSRMTVHPNGSLQISNLIITDKGDYTVKIQADKPDDIRVYLNIYEIVGKPNITTSTPFPKENDTIQLTCISTNAERIVWSRVPSGATLSSNNRTISFSSINRKDSGNYECEAINPVSQKKSDLKTISVAYGPENLKVDARSLPNSLISLTCSANSVPPPTYQWKLNGTLVKVQRNPLEVDQKKMENEGTYTCEGNNSVTLQIATDSVYVNANIEFPFSPEPEDKSNLGLTVGIVVAVILVLVLITSLLYLFVMHRRYKKNSTIKMNNSSRNGQSNPSLAETQEKPELQYASIVFSKNMPKRQQPPPDPLYANRTNLAQPLETVYSDIRLK